MVEEHRGARVEARDLVHLVLRELEPEHVEVLCHPLAPDRLGDRDDPTLDEPAQHDLRRRRAVDGSDRTEEWIGEQVVLTFGETAPRFDLHPVGRHQLLVTWALEEGVDLDLIDGRDDVVVLDEVDEPVGVEVGDADRSDQTLVEQSLHGPPGAVVVAERLMDQIQVHTFQPEPVERPLEGRPGTNRRVTGLRREEVAMLAGISAEYYVRLERGVARGVSDDVLAGLARALQLDDAESAHLFDLARSTTDTRTGRSPRRATQQHVRPTVQRVLDALGTPAFVSNSHGDILATNALGRALYSPLYADPHRPVNTARFIFLNPSAREFFVDWNKVADNSIGILRAQAGRDPFDRRLTDLIGELSTRSNAFRVRWATHDVALHRTGAKRIHHPLVGDLTLDFDTLDLVADDGQRLSVYTAPPGSPDLDPLTLLASWLATPETAADPTHRER